MKYEEWRNELFDFSPDSNPVSHQRSEAFYVVPSNVAFDYVDQVLVDPDVHSLFNKDQLGKGIETIYSNSDNLSFLYISEGDETRRVKGIKNLVHLYRNYFDRYCTSDVRSIGNDIDGPMGFICYMLWDVFVLYPGNGTPAMLSAAVSVMRIALESTNDNILASGIHGLGHWASEAPEAVTTLNQWLRKPTTNNPAVLNYAQIATSGMIL